MCAATGASSFGLLSRRSELHTIKGFVAIVIAALTLGVGSASAYAAQVNWLQNHSRPAYSDDSGGNG